MDGGFSSSVLNALLQDVAQEVSDTVAVAPFVVVPAEQLEKLAVELDAGAGVKDRGGRAMDEVRADDFVFGVFEDVFEVAFAGFFHGRGDFSVAGFLDGFDGQVHAGGSGRWDAQGHPSKFALNFGEDEADGFGGAGGGGNDVDGGGSSAFPIFSAGGVHRLLSGGVCVDGGHESFGDAKAFFEKHVNQGRQAVGGAGGVGNQMMPGGIIGFVVDSHDDCSHAVAFGRRGDDDFFGAGLDVTLGFGAGGKETGGLDDDFNAHFFPRQAGRFAGADDANVLAIYRENIVGRLVHRRLPRRNDALEASLRRVVLEQISQVVRWDDIADGDNFYFVSGESLLHQSPKNQAANASKTVNRYFCCHCILLLFCRILIFSISLNEQPSIELRRPPSQSRTFPFLTGRPAVFKLNRVLLRFAYGCPQADKAKAKDRSKFLGRCWC